MHRDGGAWDVYGALLLPTTESTKNDKYGSASIHRNSNHVKMIFIAGVLKISQ